MNNKELNDIFSIEAVNFMRKSIVEAYGNEVYFGINFNALGILEHIEIMARGNKDSVPAIISLSLEYDAVIHNHPSGELTPSRADLMIASELGNNAGVGFYRLRSDLRSSARTAARSRIWRSDRMRRCRRLLKPQSCFRL